MRTVRDLLVVGSVAFDVVATVPALPGRNATARIETVRESFGGAGGNVAMGLARLGLRPALAAIVGEDFAGSPYERALREAGVDLSLTVRASGPTARAFLFSEPGGHQQIYFFPGARDAALDGFRDASARVAHFAAGPIDRYPSMMASCGRVSFDPGQEVFHRDLAQIEACLPHVDTLFANEFELDRLAAERGLDVGTLHARGVERVVASRGGEGVVLHEPGRPVLHVAAAPARAVDPTGAGDAHRAGVLAGEIYGGAAEAALRLGAVVAAFAVEAHGPQAALPTLAEAAARYRKAFGDWPFPGAPAVP